MNTDPQIPVTLESITADHSQANATQVVAPWAPVAMPRTLARCQPERPSILAACALFALGAGCAAPRKNVELSPAERLALQAAIERSNEQRQPCAVRIRKHLADEQTDGALLQRYVAEHPTDWEAALRLARFHNASSRPEAAVQALTSLAVPPNASLLCERARATQDPIAKEQIARQALAINAIHANSVFQLGVALFEQNRYAEAAPQFELYVGLRPSDSDGWWNLGRAYAYAGNRARAVAGFWGCITVEMAPGVATPAQYYQALALLYDGSSRWPQASEWFSKRAGSAVNPFAASLPADQGPSLPPPPSQAADMWMALGTGEQAGTVLWVGKFSVAERAGLRVGDVVRSINGQAVDPWSDWWAMWLALAEVAAPGDEVVFAISRNGAAQELRARAGREADALVKVESRLAAAGSLFGVGDFAGAALAYEDVLGSFYANRAALRGFVQCKSRLGGKDEIIDLLRGRVARCPQDLLVAYGLTYWQAQAAKWEELRATLEGARFWHPGEAGLIALEGQLAMAYGRPEAATDAFERALSLGDGGDALRGLGARVDQAREANERMLAAREADEERQRAAAAQAAAARRQEVDLRNLMLLKMFTGSGGVGVPGVSTIPTGPTFLQQWSDQQNQNMMWSHNR